ncbi:hypothetical protein HYALB_00008661 [Hymenoscyphus albidus]|uniref:Uncharacterized protein n=1 Tax=Hymenoscyphus albidus TaxID=595503 RepID=A0A9N9LD56_9HELO|nr:hypothetical protein HYALB_00008661 [Hymenoscyphus albidus]
MTSTITTPVLRLRPMPLQQAARDCEEALLGCLQHPQLQLRCFENQLGSFRLWAASMQVFVNSRASLDYRLRLNENARDMVLQLLLLLLLLQDLLMNTIYSDCTGLKITMDNVSNMTRQSEKVKDSSTDSTASTTGPSAVENILAQVDGIISRLQRISSAIQQASRAQLNTKITRFDIDTPVDLVQHNELREFVASMLKIRYPDSSDEFRDLILHAIL